MAKRKTQYIINFAADPTLVNQTIINWLNANKFVYKEKYDTKYYQSGDGVWTTARCFEYYFQGNQVVIYAYLKSPKKPFPLDNGIVGAANTTPYINLINQLVSAINGLSAAGQLGYEQQGYGQPTYAQAQQVQQANANFAADADKRNRNTAIGALLLGILNVIILLTGYVYWFVLICAFILAIQGLQAKEKWIGIFALVMDIVVLLVFILVKAGIIFL